MEPKHPIDPAEALDRFFSIVREEAFSNPKFGRRLVEAVGFNVVYRGDAATQVIDPVMVAMQGREEFCRTFGSFSEKDIRKIGEAHGLLQKPTGSGKAAKGSKQPKVPVPDLIAIMWDRAKQRVDDLFPRSRQAAE